MIFLFALFGFMDLLILVKWLTDFTGNESEAPSIITNMINMALSFGTVSGQELVPNQQHVCQCLLISCLVAVPIMLFVKPMYEAMSIKQKMIKEEEEIGKKKKELVGEDDEGAQLVEEPSQDEDWWRNITDESGTPGGEDSHNIGDIFIHQLIETIEFVLGTVSNTASYLRLWALSLAHSQLAEVFFEKTIGIGLAANSIPLLVLMFLVFASMTAFVLMFMDVMECFLHDLRLHWVEF